MSMYMYVPLCLYAQIYVPVGKIPPPARSKQEHKENRSNSKDQSTPSFRRSNSNPAAAAPAAAGSGRKPMS